jgi:purine-binding chemotaxis protein CheW
MTKDVIIAEKQIVLFELDSETYGLDIGTLHKIMQMQPITKAPKIPLYVDGVINLASKVIPVIDIGKKFVIEQPVKVKNNCIIVGYLQDTTLNIVINAITEIIRISNESIESISDIVTHGNTNYLRKIARLVRKIVFLLDLEKLPFADSVQESRTSKKPQEKPEPAGVK